MAIAEMKKFRLIGLDSDRAEIMNVLSESGVFESYPTTETEGTVAASSVSPESFLTERARVAAAIDGVSAALNENPYADTSRANKKSTAKRLFVTHNDIKAVGEKRDELGVKVKEILGYCSERTEVRSALHKLAGEENRLRAYLPCTDKFSDFGETEHTFALLVSARSGDAVRALGELAEIVDYGSGLYGIVALKRQRAKILDINTGAGCTVCPYMSDKSAAEEISEIQGKKYSLEDRDDELLDSITGCVGSLYDLKLLYDWYSLEAEKATVAEKCRGTRSTFVLEGWVPAREEEKLRKGLEGITQNIETYSEEPEENDTPPTAYNDNKLLAPFQALTDQYSPPSYSEPDPAPFTAIFFFLFFGMMTADAGYGAVLALFSAVLIKVMRPDPGLKNLLALVGICSISAIAWGALFGSVFGLDFGSGQFGIGIFDTEATAGIWFNPLEEPLMMLVISLIAGAVHILIGFLIGMYKHFRRGEITDALFDDGFQAVTYVGVIMLLLAMGTVLFELDTHTMTIAPDIPLWYSGFRALLVPGLIVTLAGLLGSVFTRGRKRRGIMSKIVTGLGGLYNIVNVLSDVLSYARVFGIALASCAIGYAFNILVEMIGSGGGVLIAAAIVLAVVLHAFNLAMGVLSAYVHNARLQYLEFYGKFYEGGGRAFAPMGRNTKYARIDRTAK